MNGAIHCNLVGNALDYLLLAGEQAQMKTPRMLKHAIATLADGVELLLKARLEVYDWCLLFRDVDRAEQQQLQSGDFQSVSFDQTLSRLKNICGVAIDREHVVLLNALRVLRHKIRHYAITTDSSAAESLIAKTYAFSVDFTTSNLESHLDDEARTALRDLRSAIGKYDTFITMRMRQLGPLLAEKKRLPRITCPTCLQETYFPEGGESKCIFCGYHARGREAAAAWLDQEYGHIRPKHRVLVAQEVVMICPECGEEACIPDRSLGRICLDCGQSGEYTHCSSCGRLIADDPHPGEHCSDCWERMMERND